MPGATRPRGRVLIGRVWPGGNREPIDDGAVAFDASGRVAAIGARSALDLLVDLPVTGNDSTWVGPGIVDAHVQLAFGTPAEVLAGGVTSARDLGAPLSAATGWRTTGSRPPHTSPHVAVAGPLLTAPDGYPSRGWGRGGFAEFLTDAVAAAEVVRAMAASVDVVKVALEP